jgi:predicted transcriptional regulator
VKLRDAERKALMYAQQNANKSYATDNYNQDELIQEIENTIKGIQDAKKSISDRAQQLKKSKEKLQEWMGKHAEKKKKYDTALSAIER